MSLLQTCPRPHPGTPTVSWPTDATCHLPYILQWPGVALPAIGLKALSSDCLVMDWLLVEWVKMWTNECHHQICKSVSNAWFWPSGGLWTWRLKWLTHHKSLFIYFPKRVKSVALCSFAFMAQKLTAWTLKPDCLDSDSSSATQKLCDVWHIT